MNDDVRNRLKEASEAVEAAKKVWNSAQAEYARLAILDWADKYPSAKIIRYYIESEYNDEGGYYLVANLSVETEFEDEELTDWAMDKLYDAGIEAETWPLLAEEDDDYEGIVRIAKLRGKRF